MVLTRRSALLGLAAAVSLGPASLAVAAADTPRRLVVVLLRGAMDGLGAVVPYGDRALADARPALPAGSVGDLGGLLDLGGFFGLRPELAALHAAYTENAATIVHAVAGEWRVRSHFEAQDYLESGAERRLGSGWLNRVAEALPKQATGSVALAIGADVPLLLRGAAPVSSWEPSGLGHPAAAFYAEIARLHAPDPQFGPAIAAGLKERGFTTATLAGGGVPANANGFARLAGAAGKLLAAQDGPRLAALEAAGWDTHAGQAKRLPQALKQLDEGLAALRTGLGPMWSKTVVVVVTEFGRTVRVNGTGGTDHGTGTAAFLLGGAVQGGRVRADWPGLAAPNLFEARDLQPTTDLYAVLKGVLRDHFGLHDAALAKVFPDARGSGVMPGLIRI